ncbi:MAG TPA: hypothetical protein VFS60_16820, partial [Thermoanaerobaculia bacterium]|nr:hypothetical protein [Thermoanaerobaculia bacterium]
MRKKVLSILAVLAGCVVVVVVAVLFVVANVALKVKRVREHPDRSAVLALVGPGGGFRSLGLYLLLRPGSRLYNAAVVPWIYSKQAGIADSGRNRQLLETHLLALPDDLAAEYVSDYPLTPGRRLFPVLTGALNRGHYGALRILNRSAEGRQVWRSWLERSQFGEVGMNLPAPTDEFDGEASEPTIFLELVRLDDPNLGAVLDQLMPPLAKRLEVVPVEAAELQAMLVEKPAAAASLLAWARHSLSRREISLAFAQPVLRALLTTPSTREQAARYLLDEARLSDQDLFAIVGPDCPKIEDSGDDCEIPSGLPDRVLRRLFQFAQRKPA